MPFDLSELALPATVDGNVGTLLRDSGVSSGFIPPQYLDCVNGPRLYVASLRGDIVGGRVHTGRAIRETLFILLLDEPEFYPAADFNRDTFVPCKFLWFEHGAGLREAIVFARGDAMDSVAITGYTVDGSKRHLCIHRILAWTFKCPPQFYSSRWSSLIDCDHI